jgi:hypothetical protein
LAAEDLAVVEAAAAAELAATAVDPPATEAAGAAMEPAIEAEDVECHVSVFMREGEK